MKNAFGYLRVSGQGQISGDGFPRQKKAIEAWASSNRCQIVRWFVEKAVSGETEEVDRPAFTEMVRAILDNGGAKVVVVESLDRLARAFRIQEQIILYLAARNITLIAATTAEDITAAVQGDPMRKAVIQIQGVFAELDKSLLVKKLRTARDRKRAKEGRCEGRKPYGETKEERLTIGIIKGLRRKPRGRGEPMPFNRIARKLNEAGLPTRYGKLWSATQVRSVINGPHWTRTNAVKYALHEK
ncbi:recombinase family protein [Acidobacteriota bacterium]